MKFFKSSMMKRVLLGSCSVLLPVIAVSFLLTTATSQGTEQESVSSAAFRVTPAALLLWSSGPEKLGRELSRAIYEGRIKLEEFEKLDFTMPDEPGFGDNPEYEVFNPHSPRTVMANGEVTLPLIKQERVDRATIVPNTRPVFNIRQTVGSDAFVRQTIAMILPNLNIDMCEMPRAESLSIIDIEDDLMWSADVSKIVRDGADMYRKCLRTASGSGYIMIPLVQRYKLPNHSEWQAHHLYFTPR
jgi:hypothetical protein